MNSRTRSRSPASIGSNQLSRRWIAVSACDCRAAEFVLLLVMAWSPPALKRRHCLGFSTRRLRHIQFQPHPGRHHADADGPVLAHVSRPVGRNFLRCILNVRVERLFLMAWTTVCLYLLRSFTLLVCKDN